MVLKRKLPTQESKKEKVVEQENQFDDFDMSIETDKKVEKKKQKAGHDINDEFPDQVEDKPEDFIPAELRALEENTEFDTTPVLEEKAEKKVAEKQVEEKLPEADEQPEDILPVSFDVESDDFNTVIDEQANTSSLVKEEALEPATETDFDNFDNPFEKTDAAPAELPTDVEMEFNSKEVSEEPIDDAFATFDKEPEAPVDDAFATFENKPEETKESEISFDNTEHANWQEVVDKSEHKDESFDSFDSIKWDNNTSVEVKSEISDDRFNQEVDMEEKFGGSDNGGIVPEIPGLNDDFAKPAEVMGSNSQELTLNGDAKKKLFGGLAVVGLVLGGIFVYSNMDTTTEVANRWSGSLTEASQDIAETEQEQAQLIEEGKDITKAEDVIDFSELSSEDEDQALAGLDDEESQEDKSTTEINLLDPKVVEKTASGKEIIKAEGNEEMPEDVKQGANLISSITSELEKQKAAKQGLDDLGSEESEVEEVKQTDEGNAADINKKVDEQLAEYRKLLAQEEDPGKKVKPGKFFSGQYKEGEVAEKSAVPVAKVNLDEVVGTTAEEFAASERKVEGHHIIEYPKGVARSKNDGIRTLDHFRSLIVEKEDKRVRMPKNLTPGLRNQGFPKFKVISIVPNYGLIGQYNGKKGILMIGDTFKGWELVGVYESYAEFKSDTRKHIISLK